MPLGTKNAFSPTSSHFACAWVSNRASFYFTSSVFNFGPPLSVYGCSCSECSVVRPYAGPHDAFQYALILGVVIAVLTE